MARISNWATVWILSAVIACLWFSAHATEGQTFTVSEAKEKTPQAYIETYTQRFIIEFSNRNAAKRANLRILPLFNGYEWAITSRWDDNNPNDVKMCEVLRKHGYKGTFYLNANELQRVPDNDSFEKALLKDGNTIGGHSWSHPFLTYCSRNAIFDEVGRIRAEREASSNHPICSYAFSFCDFMNPVEGNVIRTDIQELLFRAGYYHVANAVFTQDMDSVMTVSHLLPPDGSAPIDESFAKLLADPKIQQTNPCISFDMHVWYNTPEQWAQFESELEQYGHNPQRWYCNQSEYAAYRLQYLNAHMDIARHGTKLNVTLTRPCLNDLNDPIPLTLEVSGVSPEQVVSVRTSSGEAKHEVTEKNIRFSLHHDKDQQLPQRIGWLANDMNYEMPSGSNEDADFPGLKAWSQVQGNTLSITLENNGTAALTEIKAAYRLPMAYQTGVERHLLSDLAPGAQTRDTLTLPPSTVDAKYTTGSPFFLVELNFKYEGTPARLYLTCNGPQACSDASYPNAGFAKLGPIPLEQFNNDWIERAARGGLDSIMLNNKQKLVWEPAFPAGKSVYDVEVVYTTGRFVFLEPSHMGYYLLKSAVESATDREVEFRYTPDCIEAVYVNGIRLTDNKTVLKKGQNDLLFVYSTVKSAFDPNDFSTIWKALRPFNMGFFLRTTTPGVPERIKDIRYIRPINPELSPKQGSGM